MSGVKKYPHPPPPETSSLSSEEDSLDYHSATAAPWPKGGGRSDKEEGGGEGGWSSSSSSNEEEDSSEGGSLYSQLEEEEEEDVGVPEVGVGAQVKVEGGEEKELEDLVAERESETGFGVSVGALLAKGEEEDDVKKKEGAVGGVSAVGQLTKGDGFAPPTGKELGGVGPGFGRDPVGVPPAGDGGRVPVKDRLGDGRPVLEEKRTVSQPKTGDPVGVLKNFLKKAVSQPKRDFVGVPVAKASASKPLPPTQPRPLMSIRTEELAQIPLRNPFVDDPKYAEFQTQKRLGLFDYISPDTVLKGGLEAEVALGEGAWKWGQDPLAKARRDHIRKQVQAERREIYFKMQELEEKDRRLVKVLMDMQRDEEEFFRGCGIYFYCFHVEFLSG